jgi:hypothetical protein
MTRTRRAALAAALLVAGARASAEPPAAPGLVAICFDVAADVSPVYATREIPSTNREIKAAFRVKEGYSPAQVTGSWVALDVGDAAPPGTPIGKADLALGGMRGGVFKFTLPRDLPVGRYRFDLSSGEDVWESAEFAVVEPSPMPELDPSAFLPLAEGTRWDYAFSLEAAKGVTLTIEGIEPDASGVLRGTTTFLVVGSDEAGAHLEMRRNERRFVDEWWRVSPSGLELTRRREEGAPAAVDPPRTVVPLPLARSRSWTYQGKGGPKVECRLWGPVPVETPKGAAPGWVVLERTAGEFGGHPADQTVERHWAPGVGLVREVLIVAVRGKRALRQELVLQPPK